MSPTSRFCAACAVILRRTLLMTIVFYPKATASWSGRTSASWTASIGSAYGVDRAHPLSLLLPLLALLTEEK